MKTRMMRKIAVLVTGSALALSFSIASSVADPGGNPNNGNGHSKACDNVGKSTTKGKAKGPKKSAPNGKGWKCGFLKGPNGTNGTNGPNGTNGTNGPNGTNGTNGKACPGKGNPDHPSREKPNENGKKCGFKKGQNGDNLN
jgi:hypothetical protein